ncbi:HlyD family secretion protein [Polycladidibacter stylochi]|uniref:HlyD family secretion protein n=1 Tax=Polycladidibacter stylochi TaxID=1807766 RepID=UPI00082E983E|nr:HlyD family efflux transporter periplasmic adaptor subunit [Pseudovibrio stylochi]
MSILCSLPLVASLFSACTPPAPLATGYVEGEYARLAPVEPAEIKQVLVHRGQTVRKGDIIARLETDDVENDLNEAQAAVNEAQAQLDNLKLGKRDEEIAVLEASINSAKALLAERQRVLHRQEGLFQRDVMSKATLEKAQTDYDMAAARLEELKAQLVVATLPARKNQIKAAQSSLERASARLARTKWRLQERTITAPADGKIFDVIHRQGEIASPTAPVVSMLPKGAVKLNLYVPEEKFSTISIGSKLRVNCSSCQNGLYASVSYVADGPEFTPPVIYSLENRQELVFLVEAKPIDAANTLKPGQIVDVALEKNHEPH